MFRFSNRGKKKKWNNLILVVLLSYKKREGVWGVGRTYIHWILEFRIIIEIH